MNEERARVAGRVHYPLVFGVWGLGSGIWGLASGFWVLEFGAGSRRDRVRIARRFNAGTNSTLRASRRDG